MMTQQERDQAKKDENDIMAALLKKKDNLGILKSYKDDLDRFEFEEKLEQ